MSEEEEEGGSFVTIEKELDVLEKQLAGLTDGIPLPSPISRVPPAAAAPAQQQQPRQSPGSGLSDGKASAFFRGLLSPRVSPSKKKSATERLKEIVRGDRKPSQEEVLGVAEEALREWEALEAKKDERIAELEEELGTCISRLARTEATGEDVDDEGDGEEEEGEEEEGEEEEEQEETK